MRLVAQDISCERGGRLIFEGLSFSLEQGELLELRGANGAGKSSLLRLIAGLNQSPTGSLALEQASPESSLAENCHYIGHADANKSALTLRQNLSFWAAFMGDGDVEKGLKAFDLASIADDPTRLLSSGQKRRLSLARLATVERTLWLLDEPTVGLDQNSTSKLNELLHSHLSTGGMAIVATHADLGVKAKKNLTLKARA
ncbi:MAG: heme ABC exporter ATP-binding protein CcmA [Aestuariivirga sp.]